MGSTTQIRLEAPGYAPLDTVITRNEELDGLALVAGIFFLVPLLWVMEYQDNHIYALAAGGAPIPGPGDPQAHSAPPLPRPGTEPSPSSATGNDAVRERTRRANELNVEGRELIRSGEYTAAVNKFDAAIKIVPDPRFYFNMCVAYEQMGNASAAITGMRRRQCPRAIRSPARKDRQDAREPHDGQEPQREVARYSSPRIPIMGMNSGSCSGTCSPVRRSVS